jgi:hypothetical protein
MKVIVQLDNDEQRSQLKDLLPEGVETDGVETDDLRLVRRILMFLRVRATRSARKVGEKKS